MNRDLIVQTAKCSVDAHGIYCVESPEFERLLGAAETEGEAWKIFFELLEEYLQADSDGTLVGSRAAKALGRLGGTAKTERKQAASRSNGAKGGRPRKAV